MFRTIFIQVMIYFALIIKFSHTHASSSFTKLVKAGMEKFNGNLVKFLLVFDLNHVRVKINF